MFKFFFKNVAFIGAGLLISFGPLSASENNDAEKERRYKEFIAQKVERMKKHQKSFQIRKESESECLQRKTVYDEKRRVLLEQFDLKADANIDDMLPTETFDCMDEQNLGKPTHAASHSFGDDFWNMRIKWCPELWWRFDGFDSCEKK